MTTTHIINHTHWDREWFLTSIYTSQWIPGLIDKIEQLAANNDNFKYLFDGQTLAIEDLLQLAPEYEAKVRQLIAAGHLIIGPYYCQPDWQITGGETLIRNLRYGQQDMQRYGCENSTGWLVDTFGHVSQAPQLHHLFGLNSVYVWRGVPQLEPYFQWQAPDGTTLFTIDLFGGYRNLYGVTHVPEVAVARLQSEATKLQPFYPTPDIPLFDGYDLEQAPEDPIQFYKSLDNLPPDIHLNEVNPAEFSEIVSQKLQDLPLIAGELNSGKYGATFPGTFSARTYLKVMNRDCEHLLYQVTEPLAVLAHLKGRAYQADQYETWGRMLLQNTVHDCICGVSIDQVHEKMEFSYRQIFDGAQQDIQTSLSHILQDFTAGTYAVSTNPFTYQGWQKVGDQLYQVQTNGIGVWSITAQEDVETLRQTVDTFAWQNDHYNATVSQAGTVQVGAATLGHLVVSDEQGDTYSDELGTGREICRPSGPLLVTQHHKQQSIVEYACKLVRDDSEVSATVRLTFDQSPLIRWQIDLDSRGTDFRVDLIFETGCIGQVSAGMPFDVVNRPMADTDLWPRQIEDNTLRSILLGQREIDIVKTFPFHDFVAISNDDTTATLFAKGLHSYQADETGAISITLRRSVQQLTQPNLNYRVGDAGPFFYVPDARCERQVTHELAMMIGSIQVDDLAFHQINAGFQNPPLIVQTQGDGTRTDWQFLQENLPLSSLHLDHDQVLARFFNPTTKSQALSQTYQQTDIDGRAGDVTSDVSAKQIVTIALNAQPLKTEAQVIPVIDLMAGPTWRVGENQGLPDAKIIARLKEEIADLERRLEDIAQALEQATEAEQHRLQHKYYIVKRELYEARLSAYLNEEKLARQGKLSYAALYQLDDEVAKLGLELNQMRIKRRIYDYVVDAL